MQDPNDPDLDLIVKQEIQQLRLQAQMHEQAARQMAGVPGEPKNRAERRRLARVRQKGHA